MENIENFNIPLLTKKVEALIKGLFSEDSEYKRMSYDPFNTKLEERLSLAHLNKIKDEHGNLNAAKNFPNNDNRFTFSRLERLEDLTTDVIDMCGGDWRSSGLFWYPPKSYCGWHTNNNRIGWRVYLAWAEEANKSFFRYYDQDKDEIITTWDKAGLNIHQFEVNREKPCWHCVGSYTNRISFGFMKKNEDSRVS